MTPSTNDLKNSRFHKFKVAGIFLITSLFIQIIQIYHSRHSRHSVFTCDGWANSKLVFKFKTWTGKSLKKTEKPVKLAAMQKKALIFYSVCIEEKVRHIMRSVFHGLRKIGDIMETHGSQYHSIFSMKTNYWCSNRRKQPYSRQVMLLSSSWDNQIGPG